LRDDAELSRQQLAEKVKIHPNTLYNYESGEGMQTLLFIKICIALKLDAGRVMKMVLERVS
jgi:DNA-binding XRE family transcriptional regulator